MEWHLLFYTKPTMFYSNRTFKYNYHELGVAFFLSTLNDIGLMTVTNYSKIISALYGVCDRDKKDENLQEHCAGFLRSMQMMVNCLKNQIDRFNKCCEEIYLQFFKHKIFSFKQTIKI